MGNIVILTGAGISADSGLQTFRGAEGLWCGHRVQDVATPEAFSKNPDVVHQFYNERRRQLLSPEIKPNPAHTALAELESNWPDGHVTVVTQNIDDLHERGGTKNLLHMHGELLKAFCASCKAKIEINKDLKTADTCEACGQSGFMRPDIVWFGEMPYHMDEIFEQLAQCDLFISIGTSGQVYPAAGFVAQANAYGAETIEINLEHSHVASAFDRHINGRASETVPKFVKKLLENT